MEEAEKVKESGKGVMLGSGEGEEVQVNKVIHGVTSTSSEGAGVNSLSQPGLMHRTAPTRTNLSVCNSKSLLLNVLGVEVDMIAEKLLPYLNVEDLKALSGASWGALYAVRKLGNFSNLARLQLSDAVLKNGLLKLGEGDPFIWKHLSMNLGRAGIPEGLMDLDSEPLREILEGAESLKIYHGASDWYLKDDPPGAFLRLEQVLKQTRGLKWLGLEVGILDQEAHPEFFTNPEIQRVLGGLDGLATLGYRCPSEHFKDRLDNYYTLKSEDWREGHERHEGGKILLHHNMIALSKAPLHLKQLSFNQYFLSSFERRLEPGKFIKAIIAANRMSLEEIELHLNFLEEAGLVQEEIFCPHLKRLKLRGNGRLPIQVKHFLMAQSPLEQLDIYLDKKCDYRFLQGLAREGKLGKLTRLHLDAERHVARFGDEEDFNLELPAMDWNFLQGMTPLRDFSYTAPVTDSQAWNGIGEDILRCLPPTTEKISIKGLGSFWRIESNIGDLLSRFRNLAGLDLLGSVDTVDDEGMQSLIVNCPKLTSLAISWCDNLTDFGVTGVLVRNGIVERTGISLNQLKGLTQLTIRDCFKVSREGLRSVLKFKHLRSFFYRDYIRYPSWFKELFRWIACCRSPGDWMMDTAFILRVVRQNPSLEKVCMCPFEINRVQDSDRQLFEARLRRINPRLKVVDLIQWRPIDWF